MPSTKLEKYADSIIERQLEEIDAAIETLNAKLRVYDAVKQKRDSLLAARRSLLGVGNRVTANGGTRVTQDEVAQWLGEHGPASVAQIAEGITTSDAVVRGHLSRGKDERFEKLADGKWQTRDPERDEDDE